MNMTFCSLHLVKLTVTAIFYFPQKVQRREAANSFLGFKADLNNKLKYKSNLSQLMKEDTRKLSQNLLITYFLLKIPAICIGLSEFTHLKDYLKISGTLFSFPNNTVGLNK